MTAENEPLAKPQYAPLLYLFIDQNTVPAAYRGRFGLESGFWGRLKGIIGGEQCTSRQNVAGPDGKRGLLAAPFDPGENPGEFLQFLPDRQEWTEIEEGVLLGVDRDAAPEHFLREEIASPKYKLESDRGDWCLPVALLNAEGCGIPLQDKLEKGEWHTVPRPAYKEIAERALYLYQVECGEAEPPSHNWLRETTIMAISLNYALTAAEIAALDLLHTDSYEAIKDILTDKQEREKKTESE